MSDFDKEAERERLREKYEDDRRERQSTRRMSELLLKGATMTDRHCEECGDPVFRYDGQEFCPTCGGEGAAADGMQSADAPAAGADGAPAAASESEGTPDEAAVEVETPPDDAAPAARAGDDARRSEAPSPPERTAPDAAGQRTADAGDGRTTARASLERTLVRFAREAEAAEDPRRARDLLAAAREAAEALAALDRR